MEMAFTKTFTGGFFGGEGFVLQKLRGGSGGDGGSKVGSGHNEDLEEVEETVFLKAYGTVVKKTLRSNETLRVSSGSLVAMTSTIDYDVTMMSGFKNVMFGGEGLFITTLTGPGTVWLQGMPIDRMVSEIARRVPSGGGIGLGIPIGGVGGGSSSSSEENAVEEGEENVDGDTDAGGVPLSDDVIDADRNATVASSGMMSSEDDSPPPPHNHEDDPESSESLFGDAAYGDGDELPRSFETTMEEDDFAMPQEEGGDIPEFEEPKISDEQFEDDGTTFSTYDSNAPEGSEVDAPAAPDQDGESSLLGQLWDLFKDFNDDDE
jgi:hypothetical protein